MEFHTSQGLYRSRLVLHIFWFPEYLKRARHFDSNAIGRYAWIPFAFACLGNVMGGWLSAFLIRRHVSLDAARKVSVTVFACLMASTIPAVLVKNATIAIGLVLISDARIHSMRGRICWPFQQTGFQKTLSVQFGGSPVWARALEGWCRPANRLGG